MRKNVTTILLTGLVLGLTVGCASTQSAQKNDPAAKKKPIGQEAKKLEKAERLIGSDDFDPDEFRKRESDLNSDKVVDVTEYFFIEGEQEVLVRKEVDVNFDRKFDVIRSFNKKRELISERMDTDFDGKVDVVSFFEATVLVRKEYDTNFDNKVDLWRFFEDNNIVKKEADLNYDGDIDYWEYFEGGKLDRVGIDRDSDGEVDDWELTQLNKG